MPGSLRRIVIIGATSTIAQYCARKWLSSDQSTEITLVGRDQQRIERVAEDLRVRSPETPIDVRVADFCDENAIELLAKDVFASGGVDLVLVAHGTLPNQGDCQLSAVECRHALEINAVSPALFAEVFARHMEATGGGKLAVISSVAGDRGRKSNYVYGSAKGLLTRYVEGLQHRFSGTALHVILVKPGPTRTKMTADLEMGGVSLANVETVADQIVSGIDNNKPCIYAPGKWRLIMLVIGHLPRIVFNKLDI